MSFQVKGDWQLADVKRCWLFFPLGFLFSYTLGSELVVEEAFKMEVLV